MEDIRPYRDEEPEASRKTEEERVEFSGQSEDDVPFHIPRD